MQLFLTLAGAFLLVAFATPGQGELRAPCAKERQEAGTPIPGRFVPQCTNSGWFQAKQCHGSTGLCWCVNPDTGKEVEGTRLRGEPECTTCHIQRSLALRPPGYVGHFVPVCDEDGHFHPKQTYGSIGYSWCVDRITGEEIEGTRSERFQDTTVDCTKASPKVVFNSVTLQKGPCEKVVEKIGPVRIGGYAPKCTEHGFFKTEQFHGSTGYHWCVNPETGVVIEGTKTAPAQTAVQCGACFKEIEAKLTRTPLLGAYIPKCDEKGNYFPEQSHEGNHFCVNPMTGAVEGRIFQRGDSSKLDCVNH
jgi:nidogen (entactin)